MDKIKIHILPWGVHNIYVTVISKLMPRYVHSQNIGMLKRFMSKKLLWVDRFVTSIYLSLIRGVQTSRGRSNRNFCPGLCQWMPVIGPGSSTAKASLTFVFLFLSALTSNNFRLETAGNEPWTSQSWTNFSEHLTTSKAQDLLKITSTSPLE